MPDDKPVEPIPTPAEPVPTPAPSKKGAKEKTKPAEDKTEGDDLGSGNTASGGGDALAQMNDILNAGPTIGQREKLANAICWLGKKMLGIKDTPTDHLEETSKNEKKM